MWHPTQYFLFFRSHIFSVMSRSAINPSIKKRDEIHQRNHNPSMQSITARNYIQGESRFFICSSRTLLKEVNSSCILFFVGFSRLQAVENRDGVLKLPRNLLDSFASAEFMILRP